MSKDITIQDVANKVGVSKTTISRYLNGHFANMSIETKQHIKAVIEELNYRPNRQAQSLKSKKSYLLGLIVADIENPYSGYWIKAMQESLANTDYQLMIMTSNNSIKKERNNLLKLLDQNIDGLMLQAVTMDVNQYQFLVDTNIPIVLIDRTIHSDLWPTIMSDNFEMTRKLGLEIVHKGYERIIHVSEAIFDVSPRLERYQSLKQVAFENQLEFIPLEKLDKNNFINDFMANFNPLEKRTVFFGANGTVLSEIIKSLRKYQFKFPKDCGICGFDDLMIGEVIEPALTVISQKPELIGKKAIEELLDIISGSHKNENIYIPSHIHLRDSL